MFSESCFLQTTCQKQEQLHSYKNYKTAIEFQPLGTDENFYLPYKDIDPVIYGLFNKVKYGEKIICIKGIIFRGFEKFNGKPFFVIDKIVFE